MLARPQDFYTIRIVMIVRRRDIDDIQSRHCQHCLHAIEGLAFGIPIDWQMLLHAPGDAMKQQQFAASYSLSGTIFQHCETIDGSIAARIR